MGDTALSSFVAWQILLAYNTPEIEEGSCVGCMILYGKGQGYVETGWYSRGAFLRRLLESVEQENQSENCYYNNPTLSTGLARAFFKFLTVLDRPFLLILQNTAPNRLYFGKCLYDRIQRRNELNIFALQKPFQMEQKGWRLAGFAGLTICTYYPKHWNFELDERKFERIISIKSLHSIK